MTTDVSVMICTWNNSQRLAITLEALSRCVIPDGLTWELIVVDNNCTDDTDWTVARFTSMLPILYVQEPRQGLSNARNAGLGGAHGRLMIFADDDVKPRQGWLAAYWAAYQAMPRGYYFGGPVESEFESGRPDEELLQIAMPSVKGMDWGPEPRRLIEGEEFAGANWACPTDALAVAGGFDTSLGLDPSLSYMRGGEETDLMLRLRRDGMVPWYLPEARLSHFVPASKCTLRHTAGRFEAFGRYLARAVPAERRHPHTIAGWPGWLAGRAIKLWLGWVWARARGRKAHGEYLQWRQAMGMLRETRELLRSNRRSDRGQGLQ